LLEAWIQYYRREYKKAIEVCQTNIKMDPDRPFGYELMALAYTGLGEEANALRANQDAASHTNDTARIHRQRAWVLSLLGNHREEAASELAAMMEDAPRRQLGFVALIYAGIGEREKMYSASREAIRVRDSAFLMANIDRAIDPYRVETEMVQLLGQLGYRH
jgi:tetratricopeptide (TPR) repeat protein